MTEADTQPQAGSFWQRRVLAPIVRQFRQGITPEKIALTLALGTVLALFPVLGCTTALCTVAAIKLRLNQPIIQLVNGLFGGVQLLLLLPFYRAGEWFGAPHLSLSIPQLAERFQAGPWHFVREFSGIALGGVAAWAVVAPFAAGLIYYGLRRPLRALAARNGTAAPSAR